MNRKFTIGRRAGLQENLVNNYEIIDINTYKPEKPIVLVLGGNGTTDDRAANGNAKIVSSMLGVFNEDVDLLTVNYNQALGEPNITDNCVELVHKLFLPYVSTNGQKIDVNTACKNMRNITCFAHCRGVDGPMKRIVSILHNELTKLNYNSEECENIISQIVLVAYGSNYNSEISLIKGVYCLSFSDDMFVNGTMHMSRSFLNNMDLINIVKTDEDLLTQIDTNQPVDKIHNQVVEFLKWHRRVYCSNQNNNIRLYTYGIHQSDNHIWEMDHTMMGLAREDDWRAHENASSTGNCISKCLACALCNSVANSIINQKSKHLVEFDINKLQNQIDDICKQHNYEQTKLDNVDLELI